MHQDWRSEVYRRRRKVPVDHRMHAAAFSGLLFFHHDYHDCFMREFDVVVVVEVVLLEDVDGRAGGY